MNWFCIGLYSFCIGLCWFMCVLMYLYSLLMCLWAWCGLQACRRRLLSGKKGVTWFLDYVNSGNSQNYRYLCFWTLSKKACAGKSWIWAVLIRPELSRRADWWTKRWIVQTCILDVGLVFCVSGLVFWMSGLVFECLDLYLGVWTCILVFWTYIVGVWTSNTRAL